MAKVPEYQTITGKNLFDMGQVQDHFNRAVLTWMTQTCRLNKEVDTVPGVGDDIYDGVVPGTVWTLVSTNVAYMNVDNSPGAAVWINLITGGGGSSPATQVAIVLSNSSATTVTDNTLTTVDTYTASGSDVSITKIIVTGDANAAWTIEIDSVEKFAWRAADGNKTRDIDFSTPLSLPDGSTIGIKVEHFFTGETADFKATIVGFT